MAAVTAPARGASLLGKVASALQGRAAARGGKPSRIAVLAGKARKHVVTVAALASFDVGAFQVHVPHCGSAPGWAAVCVSLLALHFAVEE
jgi:hypothetical protein